MNLPSWLIVVSVAVVSFCVLYLWDRFLVPWFAKRRVNRLIAHSADSKVVRTTGRRKFEDEIQFDAAGFCWRSIKKPQAAPVSISWTKVDRIVAFKIDLFTYDEIRLFISQSEGSGLEISEETKGWDEFVEALPEHLQASVPFAEWFPKVAFPAFETNETEIFLKSETTSSIVAT